MQRRPPPPITAAYLARVTAWYLERNFTTTGHLRRLLLDRVSRSCALHGTDRGEAERLVDTELSRLVRIGALDDARYARDKARGLRSRGASAAKIRAALRTKGLSAEAADAALADADAEEERPDAEWDAASVWARKKRIGVWRTGPMTPELRRKELAKLGRAGFSYAIAVRIVDG